MNERSFIFNFSFYYCRNSGGKTICGDVFIYKAEGTDDRIISYAYISQNNWISSNINMVSECRNARICHFSADGNILIHLTVIANYRITVYHNTNSPISNRKTLSDLGWTWYPASKDKTIEIIKNKGNGLQINKEKKAGNSIYNYRWLHVRCVWSRIVD